MITHEQAALENVLALMNRIFEIEEELKKAQENERYYRRVGTDLTNQLDCVKKEFKELTESIVNSK